MPPGSPSRSPRRRSPFRGHAIECRINAEDPAKGFAALPRHASSFLHLPGGYGRAGGHRPLHRLHLPPYYDSLMAKLIVHAPTRLEAIRRMRRALEELVIEGYRHQHRPALPDPLPPRRSSRGNYDTGFLEATTWSSCWPERTAVEGRVRS